MCLQCAMFEIDDFYVEFVTLLIENSLKLGIKLKIFVLLALEGIFSGKGKINELLSYEEPC